MGAGAGIESIFYSIYLGFWQKRTIFAPSKQIKPVICGGCTTKVEPPVPFSPLSHGAIRPNTGADDTCTNVKATYSEYSEYMAVLTHRVVCHEQITGESLIIKVT